MQGNIYVLLYKKLNNALHKELKLLPPSIFKNRSRKNLVKECLYRINEFHSIHWNVYF